MKTLTSLATLLTLTAGAAWAQSDSPGGAAVPAADAAAASTADSATPAAGGSTAAPGMTADSTVGSDATGAPAHGRGDTVPPQIDLMQSIALGMDANGDGRIDENEFAEFTRLSWFSKDTDNDGVITAEEYKAFDFGFDYIAEARGRADLFDQVKTDLFAYWDGNGDGRVSIEEIVQTAKAEFANSDVDGDGQVRGRELAFGSPTFNATIHAAGRR